MFGQLRLLPDGSYTYTLNNSNPAVNALATGETLSDRFHLRNQRWQGRHGDGNVVITIRGQNDPPDAIDDVLRSLPTGRRCQAGVEQQ